MYSPELLDHFEHPRNAGDITNADASAQVENPACGDVLKLAVRVSGSRISEIRFRAKGCVPAMACGSAVTELVKGRAVEEARSLQPQDIADAVGGLPEASSHAAHLAVEALVATLKQIRK
jgi:nitrogen fixation protein NifU and related proteins